MNPDVQLKCQQAIDQQSLTNESSEQQQYNMLPPYVEAVLKESMRMYPTVNKASTRYVGQQEGCTIPLSVLNRTDENIDAQPSNTAKQVYTKPVILEPGSICIVHTHALHRSPLNWGSTVNQFIPERFMPNGHYTGTVHCSEETPLNPLSSAAIYGGGGATEDDLSFCPFSHGVRNCKYCTRYIVCRTQFDVSYKVLG